MNLFPEYLKLFQAASSSRIATNLDNLSVDVELLEEKQGSSDFGAWVSFIMISGGGLRSFFKVHFKVEDIQKILEENVAEVDFEISNDLAFDYMNEFCNLTAGLIQKNLENNGVVTEISVPLISYGFQDLCSREKDVCLEESWILRFLGTEVKCSCFIKYYDELGVPDYSYNGLDDNPQTLNDIFEF